jgi:hypothetical protein
MARRAHTLFRLLTSAGLCAGLISAVAGTADASGDSGAVYAISNAAEGMPCWCSTAMPKAC